MWVENHVEIRVRSGAQTTTIAEFAGGIDHRFNWSPSGTKLAYSTGNVYTVNADGSGTTLLGSGDHPVWAPDGGTRIAFVRATTTAEIFTMNANGSDQVNASNTPALNEVRLDWQSLRRYPRPGSATPLRVPLVPAYAQCTTATQNSNHVAPLALDSCAPPLQQSSLLTTSSVGRGDGKVRLSVLAGNASTFADEADISITASANDVVCAGASSGCTAAGADYTGQLLLTVGMRITDQANTIGAGAAPATVEDTTFSAPLSCSATADASGGSCSLSTAADTLVPGFAKEGKRALISTLSTEVRDQGPDGSLGAGCPPACGTGDEETFLTQGTFAP
jgi:hypothetical protein